MKKLILLTILFLFVSHSYAQMSKQILDFKFEGVMLNGILNLPKDQKPKGIVLVIHGSGKTNAVAKEWHYDIRKTIVNAGYGAYMWDKMGSGKSGGTFDYNQTVYNSALEVIAAINMLKDRKIPGADDIGLYGGSRGSWVNPIVINQYKDIRFWITISGVDDKENFNYLLAENLRIEGTPQDSIDLIINEWAEGNRVVHSGGSYEKALQATENLRKSSFMTRFNSGGVMSKEDYYKYQKNFMKTPFDYKTGVPVVVENFDTMLENITIPVLALFGEKDKNVDWKKTKRFYEENLGKKSNLTVKTFPNANHNMYQSITGGFYEFRDHKLPYIRPEGFIKTIEEWLIERDHSESKSYQNITGKYFNQKEPNETPELFAPQLISTGMSEINATYSPDLKEFLYTIILPNKKYVIMTMSYTNGKWSEAEVANFSGDYSDADPFITYDGKWLYFVSKRPNGKSKKERKDWDIWRVEKQDGKWTNPERLGSDINSESNDIYPSFTKDGTLYYSSGKNSNNNDIYYAKADGNGFKASVKLNDEINSNWEGDVYISPDEDYMIYGSYGRKSGNGLYIAFNSNGKWSSPVRMDDSINRTGNEFCPIVSPDGKYFFFTSDRKIEKAKPNKVLTFKQLKKDYTDFHTEPGNGKYDIYWVDTKIFEKYRAKSK